jgi:tetratricopeptide (TPR) repeat protein
MWLDTDDTVHNAKAIPGLVAQASQAVGAISLEYQYSFDADGNLETTQYRERIVRRADYEWKGRVHEVLVNKRSLANVKSKDVTIVHHMPVGDNHEKSMRNLRLLNLQLQDEKAAEKLDPRTLFYIAKTLLGLGEQPEALKYFYQYVQVSGWEEELYHAWNHISMIERSLRHYDKAINAATIAWQCFPNYPEAYMHLAWVYREMKKYDKSNIYLDLCLKMDKPDWQTVSAPKNYDIIPLKMLANNYLDMNKVDDALTVHQQIVALNPKDSESVRILENLQEMKREKDTVAEYWSQFLKIKDNKKAVKEFYGNIPKQYLDFPSIIKIRNSFDVKTESSGKDMAIYCGASIEEWTPESVKKSGIGGSEEAVINLARELQGKGYKVTVYNNIQSAQAFDGVWYKPYYEFNPNDKWDYFVAWRTVEIFDAKINAAHKYIWMHDLMNPRDFTKARVDNIEKIIVLSKFHRSTLPAIADEKFFVTSNGVDTSLFNQEVKRCPHKLVYTSAYERGLEYLLDMWPTIRKEVPDAMLTICYGWKGFDALWSTNPERMAWKDRMVKKIESFKDQGVTELGRIDHKQVAWEMLNSGVWAYPTTWAETNCITALKAQIAGAVPVVRNLAALEETVQHGVKLTIDPRTEEGKKQFAQEVINTLLNTKEADRKTMMKDMRAKYTWRAIADQWDQELLTQKEYANV